LWEGGVDLAGYVVERFGRPQSHLHSAVQCTPCATARFSWALARPTLGWGANPAPVAVALAVQGNEAAPLQAGADLLPPSLQGLRVLELGCGHGLPGIAALAAHAEVHFQVCQQAPLAAVQLAKPVGEQ
jgi:hypothetical protein